jgi:hypothetical protein
MMLPSNYAHHSIQAKESKNEIMMPLKNFKIVELQLFQE